MSKPKIEGLGIKELAEKLRPKREVREDQVFSTKLIECERARAFISNMFATPLSQDEVHRLVVKAYHNAGFEPKMFWDLGKMLEKEIVEEAKRKEERDREAKKQWALQRTPSYKFHVLAQLASHERKQRIDKLMEWSLKDLREVLKEVASKTTLEGVPSYRLEEAKEDLLYVINIKSSLEPSPKDVEETPEEASSLLRKVIGIFRGH